MKNKAFTLIELLVVIVIIGILATISTATFSGGVDKANDAKRLSLMKNIYDEAQRNLFWPNHGALSTELILGTFGGSGHIALQTNMQKIVASLSEGTIPGDDTCIFVGTAHNSTLTDPTDDQLILVSWSNGNNQVQVVGTEYWKNEIKNHNWTKEDFTCSYDSLSDSWNTFSSVITPKFYPTGVTNDSEFIEFLRPGSTTGTIRYRIHIIQENGDVCNFGQPHPFLPVSSDPFQHCDNGY